MAEDGPASPDPVHPEPRPAEDTAPSPAQPSDLWVVILAGGVGSRFWPASLPRRPKQLLGLGPSGRPLLAETVERALELVPLERLRILTGERLVHPIRRILPEAPPGTVVAEPRARGTGPALVWAAHAIAREDPGAVMISLHADHVVAPADAFVRLLDRGAELARRTGLLFTVAVAPDRPETGYGYIRPGDPITGPPDGEEAPTAFGVLRFEEKPDRSTAARYVREGYLWNSGLFIWEAAAFLEEVRRHAPEVGRHLDLLDRGEDPAFFDRVPSISVDHAVLERSARVGTIRATFEWDDVGHWEAVRRTRGIDAEGNSSVGPLHAVESGGNITYSADGTPVVLFGVDDLVVVRTPEMTFVTPRARTAELKRLVEDLPAELQDPPDPAGGAGGTEA